MARILGIDYGVRRTGIALSDPLGMTAQPLLVIERKSVKDDLAQIGELVKTREVSRIVVGLPLNMDGTDSPMTGEVREFAAKLGEALQVPVELFDERLTTMQANRMLTEEADLSREKRKSVRDKVAASLILQGYLDQKSMGF